jgi:iron-sulfur cluster repair protein YtfE (RIC family)
MGEHRMVEQLLGQLAASEEGQEREQLVSDLEKALSVHMGVEERFLYPVVEEVIGQEEQQEAQKEHDLARDGLRKLREFSRLPGFGAAVDMLKAGILHHVQEEEEELFPRLRADAPEEITELGAPEDLAMQVRVGPASGGRVTKEELYERAKEAGIEGRSQMSKSELEQALGER